MRLLCCDATENDTRVGRPVRSAWSGVQLEDPMPRDESSFRDRRVGREENNSSWKNVGKGKWTLYTTRTLRSRGGDGNIDKSTLEGLLNRTHASSWTNQLSCDQQVMGDEIIDREKQRRKLIDGVG